MRKDLHILAYITPVYTATAIILLLAMFLTGNQPTGYEPTTYLWLALLAVGPQLVGHTGLNWSLRYVTATTVALVILTEPIISSILAWFILDESVSLYQILGGVLILAGVYAAIRNHPASEADDPRL
jgi:drug/metabolite transporter (DMT)-like permease